MAHRDQIGLNSLIALFKFMAEPPQPPKTPLKFNCASFKKKFVELRCREVVEKSTYTLIIRPKNDQKTQIFSSNHQMTGDWGETAYQTPLGLCPVFNSASFGAKTRAIKSTYALPWALEVRPNSEQNFWSKKWLHWNG